MHKLSHAQERMWFLQKLTPDMVAYNLPATTIIEQSIELPILQKAVDYVVARHSALRTVFREETDGTPTQHILPEVKIPVEWVDLKEETNATRKLQELVKQANREVFDLSQPLVRFKLFQLETRKACIYMNVHHIIMDGWSSGIIGKEIMQCYIAFAMRKQPQLAELPIEYTDWVAQQHDWIGSTEFQSMENYWLQELSKPLPTLHLPLDFPRPNSHTYRGNYVLHSLDVLEVNRIKDLSRKRKVSLNHLFLAAYYALLNRLTQDQDIIVGIPVAGRTKKELEHVVGLFINTVAIRAEFDKISTFHDLLEIVKEKSLKAFENDRYPLDLLVSKINPERDLSRSPLFSTFFQFFEFLPPLNEEATLFDLTLFCRTAGDEIELRMEYNSDLFSLETAKRFLSYYIRILRAIINDPNMALSDIEILSDEEKQQILSEFNETDAYFPQKATLHELFEEHVAKRPEQVAAVCKDKQLSYLQLNNKANRLAEKLRELGVKPDCIVGIHAERSLSMIVSVMAVLKAGGAYLPIDPLYPNDRIRFMLEDSQALIVLTDRDFPDIPFAGNVLHVDESSISDEYYADLKTDVTHHHLAYMIYTSGSTGNPKGVLIEHSSIVNRLFWMQEQYSITSSDVVLQKTPFTFDVSVWELFWWAIAGATVCFLEPGGEKDPNSIISAISTHQVTTMHFVPTMLQVFLDHLEFGSYVDGLSSLRQVFTSGEALRISQVSKFKQMLGNVHDIRLINLYGPTEAAVDVTHYDCTAERERAIVPIGKPIFNTKLFILDKFDRLQPIGVPGELCIAGSGVARGYHNLPELTNEKFVKEPHATVGRMYRTGDLARWLPDGNIEYIGRLDHQVKIRGFRIELGEIENKLVSHPSIGEAVVLAAENEQGDKSLIAYYVAAEDIDHVQLRDYLTIILPTYMIPQSFIRLDRMPVTQSGKADRKTLASWKATIASEGYAAPRDEREAVMARIWKEELNLEQIGIHDNFFSSGGDSIKVIRVINRMAKEMQIQVSLRDLYGSQTIAELAACVEQMSGSGFSIELDQGIQIIAELRNRILNDDEQVKLLPFDYEDFYPISKIQQSMLFYASLKPEEPIYHDQFMYQIRIENGPNLEIFKQSLVLLMQKHPILRTRFYDFGFDVPLQIVLKEAKPSIHIHDLSSYAKQEQKQYIKEEMTRDLKKKFKTGEPLWRVTLFKLSTENYAMIISSFHAILDGWSAASLDTELLEIYHELKAGRSYDIQPLKSSYKDYVAIQLARELSEETQRFWQEKLSHYPRNKLPFNLAGKKLNNETGIRTHRKDFDASWLHPLEKLAKQYRCSLKEVCLAAHLFLLSIVTDEEEVVSGIVTHDRPLVEDGDQILGCFLNTIPVRIKVERGMKKGDLLERVKQYMHQSRQHELFLGDIAKSIGETSTMRNPIFDTLFNYTDFHIRQKADYGEFQDNAGTEFYLELEPNDTTNTLFDLELSRVQDRCVIALKYAPSYFMDADMKIAFDLFIRILEIFKDDSLQDLNMSSLITREEREKMMVNYFHTSTRELCGQHVHQSIEKYALHYPDRAAVKYENMALTYRELNQRANQLAHYLKHAGVKKEELVGVMMDRSPQMMIAILAIWKAGAAYVPIDTRYPPERVSYMLENSGARFVCTEQPKAALHSYEGEILCLDSLQAALANTSVENLNLDVDMDSLAYVIYTSGSTGKPKGAMIEHIGMLNHIEAKVNDLALDMETVMVQNASHCFDVSVWQFFSALTVGGTTVIYSNETVQDPVLFTRSMKHDKVTVLELVPSQLAEMLEHLEGRDEFCEWPHLCYLVVMGEVLKYNLVERWFALYPQIKMMNAYGPTEASDDTTHLIMNRPPEDRTITIGTPIQNFHIYIVDKNMNLCPRGVVGEICLSSFAVGRGYINNPEKTKAVFMEDPFVGKSGRRMYRTGDLGRFLADGTIECLGRMDFQIKVRGFRVELEEIENQLLNHEKVLGGVVVDRLDPKGGVYLCAYYVSQEDIPSAELSDFLLKTLPEYMIPSFFVRLNRIPLTDNGKANRRALPEPDMFAERSVQYKEPDNEMERTLVRIWEQVLDRQRIGIFDNFFAIGGHSLNMASITARIYRELHVEVPLREMFNNPTIKQLAIFVREAASQGYSSIQPAEPQQYYPLSSAQQLMFVLHQLDPESLSYNMPGAMKLHGKLDLAHFEKTFERLIQRHEALRTSFNYVNNQAVQHIHEVVNMKFAHYTAVNEAEAAAIAKAFVRPFDIGEAPLLRIGIVHVGEERHILLYDMHHIVADGLSLSILIREFANMYEGKDLPALPVQYKDFAMWQQKVLQSEQMRQREQYWISNLSSQLPLLDLPTDYPRPAVRLEEGKRISFNLDTDVTSALTAWSQATDTTIFMMLLACYTILLAKHAHQEDIIIGTPVAGRSQADLESVIGVFINMLPLRNRPLASKPFSKFLMEVKENMLCGFDYQDYPFEEMVNKLELQRDLSRNLLFDAMFLWQDARGHQIELSDVTIEPYSMLTSTSKVDLTLDATLHGGEVHMHLEYATSLFKQETIQRWIEDYRQIVAIVIANKDILIGDIPISSTVKDVDISMLEELEFNL